MTLLSELDHEKIIHFHDAFEKRRVVVIITELYPFPLINYPFFNKKLFACIIILK